MILMLDNYDSFTYNLVQMLQVIGLEIRVFRNDRIDLPTLERLRPSTLFISPGPGTPRQAGISMEAICRLGPRTPILGVCLGHQAIAEAFHARVVRARKIMHGKKDTIFHDERTIYRGIPNPFEATRYHSLIVERGSLPDCLEVSAWTGEGEVMGLRHREYPVEGVQFHPESILTVEGGKIIESFVRFYSPESLPSMSRDGPRYHGFPPRKDERVPGKEKRNEGSGSLIPFSKEEIRHDQRGHCKGGQRRRPF